MTKTIILIGIIIAAVVIGIGAAYAVCINACHPTNQISMMGSMMGSGMMSGMMDDVPHDVIIKVVSSQKVPSGKQAQIKLLVLDKNTKQPLDDAQVIVGIERGAPMSTMNMIGSMFKAENIGDGKYVVKLTVDESGYYTLHTHVIPAGKSMHSMMNNHMDIGIIAK